MTPFIQNLLQVSIGMAVVVAMALLLLPLWKRRYSARWHKVIWLVIVVCLLLFFSFQLPWTGEEPSFWMYSGYLDEFPDGADETVSEDFSADYDGDSRQDRVYRQLDEEADTCRYRIEFANGDVLALEEPISNLGYPQVEGVDFTGDGQNEIIFYVSYPTSTNPLAFGDLTIFEKREEKYQQMQLPFMDGTDGYAQYLPVVYSKAEGQAITVSVPGTDFQQTVAIEDSLWTDNQYDTIFTRGDKMDMAVCAYQLRQKNSRHQLVCHVQLFDKWSSWGLDVVLTNAGQQFVIEDILFCEDIYSEWF